jgi:alkylation response protein AidB-like acyl-CoA dehydrogenase
MACLVSMPACLVGTAIRRYGTPEQQERWLVPLAQGKIFGIAGVKEPGSGSDEHALSQNRRGLRHQRQQGVDHELDIASFIITFATRDRPLRHRGITAFVIPTDTPGLKLRPYNDKLGFRPLCTGEVLLEDVRVGPDAVVGEIDRGFEVAMAAVKFGRLGVAARAVGVARTVSVEDTVSYANSRIGFGKPIFEFQIVQSKVTDMAVAAETASALVRRCAEAFDRGPRARRLAAMAKMYAADVAFPSAADAIQVHGAYGVSPEYRVGRLMRDAKVLQIVEGSNDLHRALIAEITLGLRSDGESARSARPHPISIPPQMLSDWPVM